MEYEGLTGWGLGAGDWVLGTGMAVFGVSLESVVKTQTLPSPPVPHLVLLCAAFIEEDGEEEGREGGGMNCEDVGGGGGEREEREQMFVYMCFVEIRPGWLG